MAFKMKGPSLYSSSPLKNNGAADGLQKTPGKKVNDKASKIGVKRDTTAEGLKKSKVKRANKPTVRPTAKPKKSFTNPDGSVNIPVNPNAPKVKVPKNNTSIKGKTQFEVDTQGVRNAVGKTVRRHKQGTKNVKKLNKKVSEDIKKVKDYFTKR
tara:strand:+ start:582 stop:1043 length:462 start_codon:yes stop_codon:yes gene_type:complete